MLRLVLLFAITYFFDDEIIPSGPMTHTDQHKILGELRDYSHKMSRYDQTLFEMLVKRDRDDEDLDGGSIKQMMTLYEMYVPVRLRNW